MLTLHACSIFPAGGGAGQAGAVLELLQVFARLRCWILGVLDVDQMLLLQMDAGGADLLAELLQERGGRVGLLVKGLPGSRSGAEPALLESTERVRTEAKRALAPGV